MDKKDATAIYSGIVHSSGGTVVQGNIDSARDVNFITFALNITPFHDLRRIADALIDALSDACQGDADTPQSHLDKLFPISRKAADIEELAEGLRASEAKEDPTIKAIERETQHVLNQLKVLLKTAQESRQSQSSAAAESTEWKDDITTLEKNLVSLFERIEPVSRQYTKEAAHRVKNIVDKYLREESDDASSIRTFYTARTISETEEDDWRELRKGLQLYGITPLMFDQHRDYIVQKVLSENDRTEGDSMEAQGSTSLIFRPAASTDDDFDLSKHTCSVTSPWAPCYLTFDGGGLRAYSSLLLLARLMEEIARLENLHEASLAANTGSHPKRFSIENLLPCHYFDLMYSAASGGINAICLGRLRMSVIQALIASQRLIKTVGNSQTIAGRVSGRKAPYSHTELEVMLKIIAKEHCKYHSGTCDGDDLFELPLPDSDSRTATKLGRVCETVCWVSEQSKHVERPITLRTYNHPNEDTASGIIPFLSPKSATIRTWEVARATTAAYPEYAPLEVVVDGKVRTLRDGGFLITNPGHAALEDIDNLYGSESSRGFVLSLGTGRQHMVSITSSSESSLGLSLSPGIGRRDVLSVYRSKYLAKERPSLKRVIMKPPNGYPQHYEAASLAWEKGTKYVRLNVMNVPVNEVSESCDEMERTAGAYLQSSTDSDIRKAARILVGHRRAREQLAQKGDEKEKDRYDHFVGRYVTGRKTEEPDGPVFLGPESVIQQREMLERLRNHGVLSSQD